MSSVFVFVPERDTLSSSSLVAVDVLIPFVSFAFASRKWWQDLRPLDASTYRGLERPFPAEKSNEDKAYYAMTNRTSADP